MTVSRGPVFTAKRAAAYIGLAESTLRNLLSDGKFPPPHRRGKKVLWYQDELDAYNRATVSDPDGFHYLGMPEPDGIRWIA